jgi:hypothetical protein
MKLSKFTAKSIEIDFNDEVREVEMNFAVMQQMTQNLGNLLDYALHIYRVAAQMEMPDAVRLSAFYAELLRVARFRYDGKPVTADMIYQAVQADPNELSNLIESCFNAALIICPVSDKPVSAAPEVEPEKKPVKRTRKLAG